MHMHIVKSVTLFGGSVEIQINTDSNIYINDDLL